MSRRALLVALIGVNLALIACLILSSYTPPKAYAQPVSLRGEFILVSAEAETDNDVIYLLDLARRQLHAFRAQMPVAAGQTIMVRWFYTRDLIRDFR